MQTKANLPLTKTLHRHRPKPRLTSITLHFPPVKAAFPWKITVKKVKKTVLPVKLAEVLLLNYQVKKQLNQVTEGLLNADEKEI